MYCCKIQKKYSKENYSLIMSTYNPNKIHIYTAYPSVPIRVQLTNHSQSHNCIQPSYTPTTRNEKSHTKPQLHTAVLHANHKKTFNHITTNPEMNRARTQPTTKSKPSDSRKTITATRTPILPPQTMERKCKFSCSPPAPRTFRDR